MITPTNLTFPGLILGDELGHGQFGVVYKAADIIRGPVAIKVPKQLLGETETDWRIRQNDLIMEGQHLCGAEHDRVVRVFNAILSEDGKNVGLVIEYCPSGSLETAYKVGPIGLKMLRKLLTDTASGLQIIHARQMLHRDLKPANILYGPDGRAKISDFGYVTDAIAFGYASMAGYLDHLAPEVQHTRLTSVRSDIWAFGMTAYRLLHGHPWYTELPARPYHMIANGGYASKLPWLPHIPNSWRNFIRKALHDDPEKRYQNAGQLLNALATLPVEPDWACIYSSSMAAWQRRKAKNAISVVWDKPFTDTHQWKATSINSDSHRQRSMGGSTQGLSREEALSEMKVFFDKQRP